MYREHRPVDRRRHPRTRLSMILGCIRLDPDGGDVVDSLRMTDISRSGMGALCQRPYYPGQRIMLNLPLPSGSGRRNVYATVIRCKQGDDGYHVGLEFDSPYVGSAFASSRPVAMPRPAAQPQPVVAA